MNEWDLQRLIYLLALLVLLAPTILSRNIRERQALRNIALVLAAFLAAGLAYRLFME